MLLWTLRFWLMLENVQQVKALPLNRKKVFMGRFHKFQIPHPYSSRSRNGNCVNQL